MELRIYTEATGKMPFNEWLADLKDAKARAIIRARLLKVQMGNFGDCKPLRDGVQEALLSNSIKGRTTPDPRRSYPTRTVSGVPSCVKRFRIAARTCSSAT